MYYEIRIHQFSEHYCFTEYMNCEDKNEDKKNKKATKNMYQQNIVLYYKIHRRTAYVIRIIMYTQTIATCRIMRNNKRNNNNK